MSKKKTGLLTKIILIFVVLIIALVVVAILLIDPIAKNALEKGAPLILGTDVSVQRIHIEPFNGRVEITNLVIANPSESYSSEHAIKLGDIIADVDLGTVTKDKIHIEEMRMKDVNVNYETNVISSNLQDILDNVKKLDSSEKSEKAEKPEEGAEAKTLQVDVIELDNVGVSVIAKGAKAGLPIHVTIDPMGPLGEDEEGITPVGLTMRILGAIVTTAIKAAGGSVTDAAATVGTAAADAAAGVASSAVDTANTVVNDAANAAAGAANSAANAANTAVNDAANAAAGAIRGLFGGNRNDGAAQPQTQPQGN
jgi:hypothetical protein